MNGHCLEQLSILGEFVYFPCTKVHRRFNVAAKCHEHANFGSIIRSAELRCIVWLMISSSGMNN